jgi:hypothetical protein
VTNVYSFYQSWNETPCAQFVDNTPIPYADEPYFRKPSRIDEQFGVSQEFSTKSELKVKIVDFHVQRNIELEVTKLAILYLSKNSKKFQKIYII